MAQDPAHESLPAANATARATDTPGRVLILAATRVAIANAMHDARPREGCGVLTGWWRQDPCIAAFAPLDNRDQGTDRFEADPAAFLRVCVAAERRGLTVLGFVHSHPNGTTAPSRRDAELLWRQSLQLIAAPHDDGSCPIEAFWHGADDFVRLPILEQPANRPDR